jgi:hypothetical protein
VHRGAFPPGFSEYWPIVHHRDQHILRLEVAVDDSLLMRMQHGLTQMKRYLAGARLGGCRFVEAVYGVQRTKGAHDLRLRQLYLRLCSHGKRRGCKSSAKAAYSFCAGRFAATPETTP